MCIRDREATLKLLDEGCTIPFIARYRKERTGNLDEVQITRISELNAQLKDCLLYTSYVLELKLSNNGGIDAAAEQIRSRQYAEPFKADQRRVVALAIELDDKGKGLIDWKEV